MSETEKLERGLGLVEATSLNMTFMVGIGPFVVIPLWCGDGRAAEPARMGDRRGAGAGGRLRVGRIRRGDAASGRSYVYLREAYGPGRWGRLMSFLFIWQTLFQGPLSIASGALGFARYTSYLWRAVDWLSGVLARSGRTAITRSRQA